MNQRYHILIALLLILNLRLAAQPAEEVYTGNVAKAGYDNNAFYGPFNIGFNFTYFGNTYSQFYVSSNGLVSFGAGYDDPLNVTIPDAAIPNNYIAPFWDDLAIDPSGSILYTTIGASPNSKLVIQFRNMGFYGGPVYMGTFAVILYENSGSIQIQYRLIVLKSATKPHGESATIGLENSSGSSGVLYSFNNPTAITSQQAIAFTPSGPTYTTNPNAIYDGTYLTTNPTLPEPGITQIISPAENAVIGSSHTFQWSASSNASSYSLKISTNPSLSGATSYNAGTNLSYDITGLTLNTTYYWGVFATNATGTTWGEIKKFTTSSTPPLVPDPQTIWTEQYLDKSIILTYTGGDASPKAAIITSLPAQGQLFQYNAGSRGSQITSVPTTITDAGRNVIYAATGSSGNGVGNFNFKMNDAGGDSPVAAITVNVSPPGVPDVLYVAKGADIEIQFDLPMANPAGKQTQFTLTVNGIPAPLTSAALKAGDANTIVLTPATPLTGTETVLVSYTQGDVSSSSGGLLFSFTNQTVTLKSQTITFAQSLTKKFNDSPLTLTASATSGLSMTYSSSNLAVATASGSVLTFISVGSSDITARQAGNGTWAPARYVKTLTVANGDQTITFGTLAAKTFGDADYTPTASATSGLTVSFASDNSAVATIVSGKIHIVGAGTAVITASQAGNALWNPAASVPQTLTVNKANQTITFGGLPAKTYGDADFTLSAVAGSGLLVTYVSSNTTVATVTGNSVHIVGAGTSVITASQGGNTNYNAAPDVPQTLTVGKATLNATAENKNKTYGDVNPAFTLTYSGFAGSDNLTVIDAAPSASTAATQFSDAGVYSIIPSGGSDNNYTFSYSNGSLTIGKALIIATADNKTKTYGDVNPPFTITYSGFVGTDNQSVIDAAPTATTTALQSSNTGTYPVTPAGGSDNNYAFNYTDGMLTIIKADQNLTFGVLPAKTYGDADFTLSAVAGSGLLVAYVSSNITVATVTGNSVHIVSAGTSVITASQAGNTNFNAAPDVLQTLTVAKADQTITFSALPVKTYGDGDFALSAVSGSALPVSYVSDNPAVATVTGNTVHIVGAGTATITASQSGNNNYNPAPDVLQTLTVAKAPLMAIAGNKTRIYGTVNPALTFSYSGFLGTDNESVLDVLSTVSTTAVQNSNAGTYPIMVSGGSDNNYTFSYTDGVLTINKADQTLTFNVLTNKSYGDADYSLNASASSGLSVVFSSNNLPVATITGTILHITGAGTAVITASQPGDGNYNVAPSIPQSLTVGKADLTFAADNKSKEYLAQMPVLTYTVSGFVNGETQSVLDVLPSIQTTASQNSPKGTYPITITGGTDNNYTYLYIPGELTITKLSQTITFTGFPEKLLAGDVLTLIAASTSALPVLFESKNVSVATVSGDRLTGVSKGTVQIRAYNAGDLNYSAAETFATVEIYTTHKDIMHLFTPNSDGFNDQWELPDLAAWGKCDVKVYNRWGKLVFADADYNNLWDGMSNGSPLPEGAYYFIIKTQNAGVVKGTVNIVR